MIGCFGEALNEEIVADRTELEDVRWFTRAEVNEIIAGRSPEGIRTPPRAAIAHLLIRTWAENG
jgi:NAD+ diphosphatase